MAKSRKSKPIAMKKPPDPERARRMRLALAHTAGAILLAGILGLGVAADRRYVEQKVIVPTEPPRVVLKNRPVWMSDFLAEEIARTARPNGTHSAFDHQLLVDTVALLKANPWIADVRQVRRAYGQKPGDVLEVDCDYRAPVALVHWKDYYWLVDGSGYKLPEAFGEQFLSRIMIGQDHKMNIRVIEGVRTPPPESGAHWGGDDLKAGVELVKLLYGKPYAEEIPKVDVSNFAGRHDPKAAQLVLVTKYNTQVRWGRPISAGDDFFVEVTPEQKLAYMQAIFDELHRIDANCAWVDLRFDTITRPSLATPQTAQAKVQQ